jgi:hypothetical protein
MAAFPLPIPALGVGLELERRSEPSLSESERWLKRVEVEESWREETMEGGSRLLTSDLVSSSPEELEDELPDPLLELLLLDELLYDRFGIFPLPPLPATTPSLPLLVLRLRLLLRLRLSLLPRWLEPFVSRLARLLMLSSESLPPRPSIVFVDSRRGACERGVSRLIMEEADGVGCSPLMENAETTVRGEESGGGGRVSVEGAGTEVGAEGRTKWKVRMEIWILVLSMCPSERSISSTNSPSCTSAQKGEDRPLAQIRSLALTNILVINPDTVPTQHLEDEYRLVIVVDDFRM